MNWLPTLLNPEHKRCTRGLTETARQCHARNAVGDGTIRGRPALRAETPTAAVGTTALPEKQVMSRVF